jgi:hypothetical protein
MATTVKKVITEDLGKIAEKALCDLIGTPYKMAFKYSQARVDALKPRFDSLKSEFAGYIHTGATDDLNDFASADGTKHLSVKTTKKGWKVCPQVIGQPARSTFCPRFGLPLKATNAEIKTYIQNNIAEMMPKYVETTFHCPVLFYCEAKNSCQLITMTSVPDWSTGIQYSLSRQNEAWNESTTLTGTRVISGATVKVTIGEFQVHNHRDCIKFRWDLRGVLTLFPECFTVREVE